jgi:hypothetical protein
MSLATFERQILLGMKYLWRETPRKKNLQSDVIITADIKKGVHKNDGRRLNDGNADEPFLFLSDSSFPRGESLYL